MIELFLIMMWVAIGFYYLARQQISRTGYLVIWFALMVTIIRYMGG